MTATRRQFLAAGAAGAGALAFGPGFWRSALAARARAAESAYGPLLAADANGLMLPEGFTSREVARANELVAGYPWHIFSDGQATFPAADGGWILVSNSESLAVTGSGSSAIRFAADGSIEAAYRILGGTNSNCAGGPTPWGSWLSCEEHEGGFVWECDPSRAGQGVIRPAMGTFTHEAVTVDPVGQRLYMTEDRGDGCLYRFTPERYPDLSAGLLEVMVERAGVLGWDEVPDPAAITGRTRYQVEDVKRFDGGEGIWFDSGTVYFSTKGDDRVWAYDTVAGTLGTIYDRAAAGPDAPLSGVDNLTVSRAGEVFVCEDGGNLEICVIEPEGTVAPFLRLVGEAASGTELAGVVFDPSGDRMYFASQRSYEYGVVYEVTGPFRAAAASPPGEETPGPPGQEPSDPSGPVLAGRGRTDVVSGDADAPGLRLRAQRRRRYGALRRSGLLVEVVLDEPGELLVALRTDDLRLVPGKRGSTPRPGTVTLDRRRFRPRRHRRRRIRFRVGRSELRRLRRARGRVTLQVVAELRGDAVTRVATRRLRLR